MGIKNEAFQGFARRILIARTGTQAFVDLLLAHIASIAAEHGVKVLDETITIAVGNQEISAN